MVDLRSYPWANFGHGVLSVKSDGRSHVDCHCGANASANADIIHDWLVVEPPLKNHGVKVSWDHDIPN